MRLQPLDDRVLVRPDEPEKMIGSIHIPDDAQKNSKYGTIVAVGPGKQLPEQGSGVFSHMPVKVGDRVIYGFGGEPIEFGEEKYLSLRADYLLAVVKD